MKTKLELLFVSLLMSFSYLYAQTAPLDYIVDIETKKLTGYDLIKKIEKQSGYFISYSESVFEVPQNIVLQKSKESISFFLDILFKFSEQREYVVKGRKILIKSNKKKQNRASENIKNALMISAKLIDSVSNDAVGYATVQIINQTLGTISNEEGKFEFIIPKSLVNNKIQINCIGYENKVMIIKTLLAEPSRSIKLTPKTYQLGDVKVKPKNALEIFKRAIRSIPDNYPTKPIFLDAFMRTLIKENNHYVRLTEAASKVYYSGYGQPIDKKKQEKKFFGAENTDVSKLWPSYYDLYTDSMDQAKIIQARISKDYSRLLRTRFVSGGPLGILASDKVKYPNEFTDNQHFKRYRFKLEDITSYKNKRVYVISFSPKNNQKDRSPGHKRRVYSLKFRKAPFKGRIYIDIESLAFISFQYELARPEIFKNMFWKWGQLSYQVRIDYKQYNGKWYLHQIKKTDKQIEMAMDNKQKSKMDTLEVHSQILINNIHLEKVKPFDSTEVFPHSYSKTLYSYPESYNKNFWSNYTTTTSTELEKEVLNDLSIDENLEDQFTSTQVRNDSMNAPVAKTVVKCDTLQNDIFCDGYSWMEVDSSQELMDHLLHENRYFKNYMIPTRSIQKKVQKEMVERSTLDKNVSYRMVGDYFYYERYNRYGSYKLLCRKKGSISGAEEVLLDYSNLANRHDYFDVFDYEMSPDQTKLLLLVDFKGSESYTGYIYEIQPAPVLIDSLVDVQNIVWTNSGKSFYYVKYNKNLLAKDVYFHEITQNQNNDKLVYKEPGKYYLGLYSDDKNKYLFLVRTNNFETEIKCRKLDEKWDSNFKTICPLRKGHYYIIDKIGEHIYILSNKNKTNSQIFKVHISTPYENNWQLVYENNEEELIKNFSIYDGHLVMMTTKNAFDRIHILNLKTQKEKIIQLDEPGRIYTGKKTNEGFLFYFSSKRYPLNKYQFYFKNYSFKKLEEQRAGIMYNPQRYAIKRLIVPGRDGEQIPLTLCYKKRLGEKIFESKGLILRTLATKPLKLKSEHPVLLTAYGTGGISYDMGFENYIVSLLDRGFIYAIAHVRGGAENGGKWHDAGRLHNKQNSFNDFIDCSQYLINEHYTSPDKLIINGASSGATLIAAVLNAKPNLYNAAILEVPSLDVFNCLKDSTNYGYSLYLNELGNLTKREDFNYIKGYNPYTNIQKRKYPPMLFISGYLDTRVNFWEATKYVSKLRKLKTDSNKVLLYTDFNAGHTGLSGRFGKINEKALKIAYIIENIYR